jgi:hypothetical protein
LFFEIFQTKLQSIDDYRRQKEEKVEEAKLRESFLFCLSIDNTLRLIESNMRKGQEIENKVKNSLLEFQRKFLPIENSTPVEDE